MYLYGRGLTLFKSVNKNLVEIRVKKPLQPVGA